jgi:lactoylglutathione lyase
MKLEHVAIWTSHIDRMKEYYTRFFGGVPNNKYINKEKDFESYFLQFASGARLELMYMPGIPENSNDTIQMQHKGIIHLAFGAQSMLEVDKKAKQLKAAGYPILSGPRLTGDGYYEFETLDPENNRIEITFQVQP